MSKAEKIRHEGVVERVEQGRLVVRIVQTSACAACGARNLCRSAESKEKLIDAVTADGKTYEVGQPVAIEGRASFGMKAVRIAFLYPLLLLVAAMVLTVRLTEGNELLAALVALGVAAVYYIVLSFFRSKLASEFSFVVVDQISCQREESQACLSYPERSRDKNEVQISCQREESQACLSYPEYSRDKKGVQ